MQRCVAELKRCQITETGAPFTLADHLTIVMRSIDSRLYVAYDYPHCVIHRSLFQKQRPLS